MKTLFKNRYQAGSLLARRLTAYAKRPDVIVLALPRGGVPVGFTVAQALEVPLDFILVRKLGLPGQKEYAIGAIAAEGTCLLQTGEITMLGVPMGAVEAAAARERQEVARRETLYRGGRPGPQLRGKVALLVDDGIATGSTMQLAVWLVRRAQAAKIIVAVPVGARDSCAALASKVDGLVCLSTPQPFFSVGQWYEDFDQTSDEEVTRLLGVAQGEGMRAAGEHASSSPTSIDPMPDRQTGPIS